MKRIFAAIMAFVFALMLLSPSAEARLDGIENTKALNSVVAIERTVYTFDQHGRYVELDYQYKYLNRPTSEQDLDNQLSWLGGSHSKSKYSGRVFVEALLLNGYDEVVYESHNSFLPERTKRRGRVTYRTPEWGPGDLYFEPMDWDSYGYSYDDPKVKKVKPWSVDIYFDWVQVEGIEQVDPDLHKFVDVLDLAPEWGYNPAIETVVHKSGEIKLYARSYSGFKPVWVNITTYADIADNEAFRVSLPYTDDMSVAGDADTLIVIEFIFDQDPVVPVGGGKG